MLPQTFLRPGMAVSQEESPSLPRKLQPKAEGKDVKYALYWERWPIQASGSPRGEEMAHPGRIP